MPLSDLTIEDMSRGIMDSVALTGQTGSINSTNLNNSNVAGLYRVHYYIQVTTSDLAAGTIRCDISYNDGDPHTLSGQTLVLTAKNQASTFVTSTLDGSILRHNSGSIAYSTTLIGVIGAARYALYIVLERLQ